MKFFKILFQLTFAIGITFLLFISLPVIYRFLGSDLLKTESQVTVSPLLVHMEQKKQEKKKIKKPKPRQIKAQSRLNRSRSFEMKFTPDLGVGSSDGVGVEESNLENVIFEEGEADVDAIPISRSPVAYPRRAREAGISGAVEMILLIDRKGSVANISFVKVPHPMFKKPIEKVVLKWKFKPAMNKGVPVNMRVRQPLEFNLDK